MSYEPVESVSFTSYREVLIPISAITAIPRDSGDSLVPGFFQIGGG
jgi:hypothetical protein